MKKDSRYIIILVVIFLALGAMFLVSAFMKKNEPKKKATPLSTEHVLEDPSSEDIPKEDKFERRRKEALATLETQTPVIPTTEIIEPFFATKEDKNKKTL